MYCYETQNYRIACEAFVSDYYVVFCNASLFEITFTNYLITTFDADCTY